MAVIALLAAACGHPAAGASHATCRQQFETWKHRPGPTAIKTDGAAVSSAIRTHDFSALKRALEQMGTAAATVAPVPHCADPAGYYRQVEAQLVAIGDKARTASGAAGLIPIEAAFREISLTGQKLNAELLKTVGKNY